MKKKKKKEKKSHGQEPKQYVLSQVHKRHHIITNLVSDMKSFDDIAMNALRKNYHQVSLYVKVTRYLTIHL